MDKQKTSRKSKVDSILFEKDYGPASKLLKAHSSSGEFDFDLPDEILIDDYQSSSSSNNGSPSRVQFDQNTKPEAVEKSALEKLQAQLEKVRSDLDNERANRKRKEKSLIKLAQELKNRSSDLDNKEKKIEELEETVQDLMDRLSLRSKESNDVVELGQQNRIMERKLKEYEEKLAYQKTLLRDAKRPTKTPEQSQVDDIPTHKATKRGYEGLLPVRPSSLSNYSILVALSVVLLYTAIIVFGAWDVVCAPVWPGSTLDAYEATVLKGPWWVPDGHKEQAFNALCYKYPQTLLKLGYGKLEIVKDAKTVWKGHAPGVIKVGWNAIHVVGKKGLSEEVPAPWRTA